MRFIPKYRVGYNGKFYEACTEIQIASKDIDEMKKHGTVLDDPVSPPPAPKRVGRPRRAENGQSGKAETENRRA